MEINADSILDLTIAANVKVKIIIIQASIHTPMFKQAEARTFPMSLRTERLKHFQFLVNYNADGL